MMDKGEPVDLGPRSGPRLAAMACPECGQVGKLSVWRRTICHSKRVGEYSLSGEQMKVSVGVRELPALDCDGCGQLAIGEWSGDGHVMFPSLEKGQ